MAGFFKQLDRHRRRLPKELEQYDDEYLRYCVEKDLVETVLESTLHETDDPKEISDLTLKTVCDFYGGDWSGVMDIDMDTCLWRPVCWFRAGGANDTTLERLSGLEDAEVMPRWLESMKSASPIVLTDTSEIRESCPIEYALYERLDARSIIASPFSPSPTGFLVIRNPSRYLNHPEALFIFAYVLHRALAQQNTMEREEIIEAMNPMEQSYDVYISFFRDLEIRTAGGTLTEQIINAPKTIQLVAYLLLMPDRIWNAAEYTRLSRDDGDKAESNSITSQKEIIRDYVRQHPEFVIVKEYADDGYSGVNFERPGFKQMMEDIKAKKIDCVICKDLSRFARNYIDAGRYLEKIFPFMGVRFIAINDSYDSCGEKAQSDALIVPFKNLINDAYCRDISVKIRSQLDIKRMELRYCVSLIGGGTPSGIKLTKSPRFVPTPRCPMNSGSTATSSRRWAASRWTN